ncbi:hypothetical protein N431DRAFT_512451 [Stipitochalara longipes BDJ]|nr:hypothetical protein N431DRAFT_512451 [Stipitochalara longipes BDJ]
MVTSGRSNPLRSFGNNTPTPEPSFATPGGIMGSGVQDRKEAAGKPTLMQQIQQAKAMGIDAGEAIMGGPTRSGNTQPTSTPKKPNGGAGVQPNKSTGGLGRTGQPGATPTQENKPFSTPSNKDKKPNSGSTQKKLNSNKGSLPSLHPVVENGNVQKRPVSTYLEDVPNNQEQEREHKRPAQRQWVAPARSQKDL